LVSDIKGGTWRRFGPKRDEVTGDWRKLHIKELHNLYASPSIITIIKSKRMRWAGHVAQIGRREMHVGYCGEGRRKEIHWEDQDVGG
jgi:hypothetical protein